MNAVSSHAEGGNVLYFTDRLMQSLPALLSGPLTVVEAPMGYGKTLAVREFLQKAGVQFAWVSVSEDGEAAFWRDFCQGLAQCCLHYGNAVQDLADVGYPHDSVRANAACERMLQLDFNRRTVLVIDDYHLLPGMGPSRFIELMAVEELKNLHLVIITRVEPGIGAEILKLKGKLNYVGTEVFALTAPEIQAYYKASQVTISPDDARRLYEATSGWISALYLYLLRYKKHGVLAKPASVDSLIDKEVYAPLSSRTKDLLFRLAPLERFNAEQAEFLAGQGNIQDLLDELRAKNSFIFHDRSVGVYIMHSLFREYLNARFAGLPAARRRSIHLLIGDWHVTQGQIGKAVEAYYAAEDFEKALQTLESDMNKSMVTEKASFFTAFFKACPEEVLRRYMPAAFKFAIALFSSHDYAGFGRQCAWLAGQCEKAEDTDKSRVWRGELEFLYSLMAYNDIAAMSAHHRKAYELLQGPTGLFAPDSPWTLGCPSVLFMFHSKSGNLAHELLLMKECMPSYYLLAQGHGSGSEYVMEAEALFNAGDFENAEIVSHKAEAMAARAGQTGNVFCALFLRMRLAAHKGKLEQVALLAESMRGMIKKGRDSYLFHTIDVCEGFINGILGQADKIPGWLRRTDHEENRLYTFARGVFYFVHGRALLLDGQYARAAGLFDFLLEAGQFEKFALFRVYANIYLAAAHFSLGKSEEAEARLARALEGSLPDNLLMPFVENYDFLESLLKKAAKLPEFQAGVTAIQELAYDWERLRKRIIAKKNSLDGIPLTARELELARLAAQGLKYREIAEHLYLAPTTVKKAFVVIYRKLGITGRRELQEYLQQEVI